MPNNAPRQYTPDQVKKFVAEAIESYVEAADTPVEAAGYRRGRRPRTGGQRDPVPGPWTGPGAPARLLRRPTRPSGAGLPTTPQPRRRRHRP